MTAVPSVRFVISAVFDPSRGVLVLHGGRFLTFTSPNELDDTWEYHTAARLWTNTTVSGAGPGRTSACALAFDARRGTVVLWGGSSPFFSNLTWEYGRRGTFRRFGNGCPGSAAIGTPTLAATSAGPVIGQTMGIRVSPVPSSAVILLGWSDQRVANGPVLPLDLTFTGAPGCTLYVSLEFAFATTSVGGVANFQLSIPPLLGLSGLKYFQQALVLDSPTNALQHVMTNAAELIVL